MGTVRCWKCSLSPVFHATFPRLSRSSFSQAKQVSSPVFSCLPSSAEQKALHGGPLPPLSCQIDWDHTWGMRVAMQETDRATSLLLSIRRWINRLKVDCVVFQGAFFSEKVFSIHTLYLCIEWFIQKGLVCGAEIDTRDANLKQCIKMIVAELNHQLSVKSLIIHRCIGLFPVGKLTCSLQNPSGLY